MKSMTGYGTASRVFREGRLSVELKTLNGRFFELHYKAPREFSIFEPKIIEELKKVFARGSIEMIVSWQTDRAPDRTAYWKMFQWVMRQCVARVERMRKREGAALFRMLRKQWFDLKKEVELLMSVRGQWIQKYEARLRERIRMYLDDKSFDAARLHQEAAILISRTDIYEELDRLKSHLSQFFSTMTSKGEIGKKLDFLLQEMNREVNTIGSKAQDSSISSSVICMKSLIEKLKEQTQNVE